jgi:hypothetical protein
LRQAGLQAGLQEDQEIGVVGAVAASWMDGSSFNQALLTQFYFENRGCPVSRVARMVTGWAGDLEGEAFGAVYNECCESRGC